MSESLARLAITMSVDANEVQRGMDRAKRITKTGMDEITRAMSEYGRRQMESINLVSGMTESGVQTRLKQESDLTEELDRLYDIQRDKVRSTYTAFIEEGQQHLEARKRQIDLQKGWEKELAEQTKQINKEAAEETRRIQKESDDARRAEMKALEDDIRKRSRSISAENAQLMTQLMGVSGKKQMESSDFINRMSSASNTRIVAEQNEKDQNARIQRAIERDKRYAKEYTALTTKMNADAAQAARTARMLNAVEEDIAMKRERRIQAAWKMQQRQIEDAQRFREGQAAEQPSGITADISQKGLAIIPEAVKWQEQYNDLQKEAATLLQRLATPEQQHTQRLARYNMMLQENIIDQQQFNAAVQASTRIMQAQQLATAGGFSAMGGAAAQASYAVEDFIQVMAMGGGLNMALMSASNNLSMVARSLIGTGTVMSAMAGSIVPLAIIGLGTLAMRLLDTKEALNKINEEFDGISDKFKRLNDLEDIDIQHKIGIQDILDVKNVENAVDKLSDLQNSLSDLATEQKRLSEQRSIESARTEELFFGGEQASLQNLLLEMRRSGDEIANLFGDAAANDVRKRAENLEFLYQNVLDKIKAGEQEAIVRAANEFRKEYERATIAYLDENSRAFGGMLVNLQTMLDNEEAMAEWKKRMVELGHSEAQIQKQITSAEEQRIEARQRLSELQQQELMRQEQIAEMKREQMLFDLQATDLQKDMRNVNQQMVDFIGPMLPMNIDELMQANQLGLEFLTAMAANLEQQIKGQNEIPAAQGALFQDAMDAQAEAFKQMAQSEKKNPQLERQIQLLEAIRERIAAGAAIQVVP